MVSTNESGKKVKQVNTGDRENSGSNYTDPKSVRHSNHANVHTPNPVCVLFLVHLLYTQYSTKTKLQAISSVFRMSIISNHLCIIYGSIARFTGGIAISNGFIGGYLGLAENAPVPHMSPL